MGVNLAPKCRHFLIYLAADMCIALVRVRSTGVDASITQAILIFIRIAPKCRHLLLVLAADKCIAPVSVRSTGVDASISQAILMFIW